MPVKNDAFLDKFAQQMDEDDRKVSPKKWWELSEEEFQAEVRRTRGQAPRLPTPYRPAKEERIPSVGWGTWITQEDVERYKPPERYPLPPTPTVVEEKPTEESKIKDIWDAFRVGATEMGHRTKQYFQSVLPNILFRDVYVRGEEPPAIGVLGEPAYSPERAAAQNERNRKLRAQFKAKYTESEQKHQEWLKGHPELQPRKEWEKGTIATIKENPKVLLDPAYIGYVAAESASFTMAFLGTTLGVTALTKNPFLGLTAGVAVTTPAQTQDLYEDLTNAGATEEQASQLAMPIGAVISSVEIVGAFPLLRVISKPFTDILRRNITREVAKRTIKGLTKRGLKTFTQVEIAEVMEEIAQGAIQDATVKTFDENRDLLEGIPETTIRTAIATLPFALFGGGAGAMRGRGVAPEAPPVTPPVEPTVAPPVAEAVVPPTVAPPIEPAIPKAAPGMPEVGIQPRPREEIAQQIDQVVAEIEGLSEYLATEPAAKLISVIKKTGWHRGEISNLTIKQYKDITGKDILPNLLTPDKKHVRWEYALDDIATEMGYPSGDVLRDAITTAGEANARLTALKSQRATLVGEMQEVEAPTVGITLPAELPTVPPPLTPEAEALGRTPNEWTGSMVDLQDAATVHDIAFRNDYVREWVNRLPGIRSFARILNPSAVANTPTERSIIVRATLRDEGKQKSQGVIAHLSELGSQEKIFGKVAEDGTIAKGALKGIHPNDIRTYPKRYKLTAEQKQWIERANDIEKAKLDFLTRNGIDINELTFEEGGLYAGRRVYARVFEGEILDTAYVGVGPGRVGAKLAAEKRRTFKTAAEATEAGYRYLAEDEALFLNVQGAYNRVADKQMADWLLTKVTWRTTGASEELILAAEQAQLKYRHSQQLLAATNRAVRGERVPGVTINSIARSYLDQAQELRNLIPLIQAGALTAKRVQNLTRVAKGLIDTNKGEWQRAVNARARSRETALRVGFREAVIPAPAFAGKILTGPEAKETAKVLRQAFEPGFSKALQEVNKANAVARYFMLAGDVSPMTIQLIFLAGENPVIYGKAFGGFVRTLFSPEFHSAYLTKHKATIDKHPNLLLTKAGATEFTEAMSRGGWLSGKRTLIPQAESYWKSLGLIVPRTLGKIGATVLTPFQRGFEIALDVAGIELAEAYDYLCTTPVRTADVDQFINEFRGVTSSARLGVSPLEQQIETSAVLAPRYNRAIAGLLFDLGRGGIRGSLARKSLAKGITALSAMAVIISLARGEDKDEILDHFNPNSSNFFTWDMAGQKIGPGSKVRSVIKLFAQSADNPESLFQLGMDNPAFRFVRGNLAPVAGAGIELITGRSYIGDPTRDGMLSFSKEILAGNLLPIWVQSVLLEGGDLAGRTARGVAEFFGGRGYPEPIWNTVSRLRDKYAQMDLKLKYEDLNRAQIDGLRRNHPDLVDLEDRAKLEGAKRGSEFEQWVFEATEKITGERDAALEKAANAFFDGFVDIPDYQREKGYARPYYSGGMTVLWLARESLDPYAVKQIEKWMGETQKPEDKALDKYQEYRANLIDKADLPRDWDKLEKQTKAYLSALPKPIREYVIANKNRWIEKLPPNVQKVERLILELGEGLEDYYQQPEGKARIQWRTSFPEVDARLFVLARNTTLKTRQAALIVEQIRKQYGIPYTSLPSAQAIADAFTLSR